MKKLTMLSLVVSAVAVGTWGGASAQDHSLSGAFIAHEARACRLEMLKGSYLFAASGFNIVGGAAQPKAIHEVLEFNGDGTLTVPSVTLSVNGTVSHPPGSEGEYTLEESCRGTLVFGVGPSFDIVVAADGETVWMFQTNPYTVFQGTATRFDR